MSSNLKAFSDLLQKDLVTLQTLEDLLHRERTSLEENQLEVLDEITEQKKPLLLQIQKHAKDRTEWVKSTRLSLPRFLALLEEKAPPVMSLYQQCESSLREVKTLNEVNGQILARSQQRLARLMQIIRGQGQQPGLYGKNGSSNTYGGKQSLAQA